MYAKGVKVISDATIEATRLQSVGTSKDEKVDVTVEDINRVLEVGRMLISILTQEELEELRRLLTPDTCLETSYK